MKNNLTNNKMLTIALLFIFKANGLTADNLNGLQVVQKAYNKPEPKTQQAVLKMTLVSSSGGKRERILKQFVSNNGKTEKKIMFFEKPSDVRDTSFMNFSYDNGKPDDQWIYLPALKRVKRISNDSKGDYFMGSDFTYDDLGDRNPNDDNHQILKEEILKNENCYVVVSTPKDKNYMYSKTVTWIIKDKWLVMKKVFYDTDGNLLKTLTMTGHEKINGYWIRTGSEMINEQTKHETIMKLSNIKVNVSIPDSYFSERRMKRGIK
ncbi:MAG: outer membrane lipoprotein-sorting protein [Spirochaetia bacterium]|nr:outer membrane lipoprotein-sorting protein [Spirochaetia bacterium]